jgi:hypothetical protein
MQQQKQEKAAIVRAEDGEPNEGPEQGASLGIAEDIAVEEAKDQECPELVPQDEEDDSDDEMEIDEEEEKIKAPHRSERIRQGVSKPPRYAAATVKLWEGGHNEEKKNAEIKAAKLAEIKQVFEELQALEPVDKEKIPEGIKLLGCHLFMV